VAFLGFLSTVKEYGMYITMMKAMMNVIEQQQKHIEDMEAIAHAKNLKCQQCVLKNSHRIGGIDSEGWAIKASNLLNQIAGISEGMISRDTVRRLHTEARILVNERTGRIF
jgi:hypothetical protein